MNNCINTDDTVLLESLLRHVLPTINNIPHELGVDLLRQAFTEFAQKSQALAVKLDIQPQRDVVDYELVPPKDYSIYLVREAGYNGRYVTLPQAHYWYISWGARFSVVGNQYIIFKDTPVTDEDNIFSVIATVIPSECINTIPREVSIPYGKAIAAKAIATALRYKNKPWHDPQLAQVFEREFYIGVNSGKNLSITNRGAADMTVRPRRWI